MQEDFWGSVSLFALVVYFGGSERKKNGGVIHFVFNDLYQVVTFWEGEIVDTKNYTFFTGKWEATYVSFAITFKPD